MTERYLPAGVQMPPLNACTDCGLVVWNKTQHDKWHDKGEEGKIW